MVKKKTAKREAKVTQMSPTSASLKESHAQDADTGKSSLRMNRELGGSGTNLIQGIISEDYNQELSGLSGMQKFDLMRRTDAQINAVLLALELPIRATNWSVKPPEDEDGEIDEQAWEITDFVEDNLFNKLDRTWDNLLKEICTMFPFGFSLFEKVWGTDDEGNIILKKIAYRKQTTISKWETQEGLPGVEQISPNPIVGGENDGIQNVSIPATKLVLFTNQKEWDNYEGISVLRSCYKHWFFKDNLYRFDGVRHERQSIGIPMIYLGKGATDQDKDAALEIVKNIRGSEQTGVVVPWPRTEGWEFGFADLHASDSTNLFESIKHHNREIAKSILAQFLELGDTASGSRALSEDQSDLFLLCLTAAARNIADIFNRFVIPELVDYNYDGVKQYPTLEFDKIGSADLEKFSNIISTLVWSEVIHADENIEDHLRDMLSLPPREKGVTDGTALDPTGEVLPTDNEIDPNADPLDDLQSQLDTLQASEDFDEEDFDLLFDEMTDAMEFALDEEPMEFVAKGGHLTAAHKKAISEALLKAGGGQLQQWRKNLTKKIADTTDTITKENTDFKARTDGLRSSIEWLKTAKAAIPAGKAGTAQRKKLLADIKAINTQIAQMRAERNQKTEPLKTIRTNAVQTRRQVLAVIKERKTAIVEKTKQIRAFLQAGRLSLQSAIEPMKQQVADNWKQIQELRSKIKGLEKNDPKRDAMKAMIDWLTQENTQNRNTQASLRKDFSNTTKGKSAEIAATRAASGLYSEEHIHDEHCHHEKVWKDMVFDDEYLNLSARFNNKFITQLQNECVDGNHFADIKKKGFKINKFEDKAARPLTFAERKVNFDSLGGAMESFSKILNEKITEITDKQKIDLLAQVKKAVESNDINAVSTISAKYAGELAQALTNIQKELFEIGKKTAATEMGVQVPPTAREVSGAIRVQNDAVVAGMISRMELAAKTAITEGIAKKGGSITNTGTAETVAAASENLDKVFTSSKATLNTLGITGAVNLGRSSIFERYPEKIYGFQYSAILDDRTTQICRSLDGLIVPAGSPDFYAYAPPRHYNCRSIWVEILQEETFKPKFTGVPSGIPANVTLDTFKDLKAPIILKNSPAIKIIQEEIDDRKLKLKTLQESGKFPNRQKQHEARIKELENSLDTATESTFEEYVRDILRSDWISFSTDEA